MSVARPLRLLLIEDSPEDAELVVNALVGGGYDVYAARIASADALAAALEEPWDLAIADFTMPGFSGTAALRAVRERGTDMPFIFVSGTIGEETAVAAMHEGAHDYIIKGNLKRLLPAVERELREAAVRRERTRAEERLAHLAYHDPLTDLPNRRLLRDRLEQAIRLASREDRSLALLLLDLDGFKNVNDTLGHYAGDQILEQVAARLREAGREGDTVARLGGDEFAIVLPTASHDQAERVAGKLLHEMDRSFVVDGRALTIQASIGIAVYPFHGANADALVQNADAAMYAARTDGCAYKLYCPARDQREQQRAVLVNDLRHGLATRQFSFDYQPIASLRTGLPVGVEALVRWNHPTMGRLMPASFIPLAEQTGLIDRLTILALDHGLDAWPRRGAGLPMNVAINVSPRSLRDPDFGRRVEEVVGGHGASGTDVTLEITENVIVSDPTRVLACLERLHATGVRLVVDDFGTGYSSLSYLRRLPVDALKIDKSFVTGLGAGADEVIVRSIIDLAHNLGLTVVAEGVESQAIRDRLVTLGCDLGQGVFIGPPDAAARTRERIQSAHLSGF